MTDKEKLIKIKSLADKIYDAAFNMTTDASLLRKAMDEYRQFIINKYHKEEPVSEELDEAAQLYAKKEYNRKNPSSLPDGCIGCYAPIMYAFKAGANWQEEQDQSTIELAEDHAMLAGMEKMKEQMMTNAKSGTVQKDNQIILDNGTYIDLDPSMQLKPSFVGLKEGDRIKVIVIKED